jgi:Sulfite exporter TauE/SafE
MADLHAWWMYPLLTLLGGALGTYGTLIGAGGGIFLVPTLLVLYPQESPNTIASMSLAVVFFNAASGTMPMRGCGVSITELGCSSPRPPCRVQSWGRTPRAFFRASFLTLFSAW